LLVLPSLAGTPASASTPATATAFAAFAAAVLLIS
jgi:hypothetical protein